MVIIAREPFNAYGENKLLLYTGSIADIPDDLANQMIREGKAYRYDFADGIDYEYDGNLQYYWIAIYNNGMYDAFPITPGSDQPLIVDALWSGGSYASSILISDTNVASVNEDEGYIYFPHTYPLTVKEGEGFELYEFESESDQYIYAINNNSLLDNNVPNSSIPITFTIGDSTDFNALMVLNALYAIVSYEDGCSRPYILLTPEESVSVYGQGPRENSWYPLPVTGSIADTSVAFCDNIEGRDGPDYVQVFGNAVGTTYLTITDPDECVTTVEIRVQRDSIV